VERLRLGTSRRDTAPVMNRRLGTTQSAAASEVNLPPGISLAAAASDVDLPAGVSLPDVATGVNVPPGIACPATAPVGTFPSRCAVACPPVFPLPVPSRPWAANSLATADRTYTPRVTG